MSHESSEVRAASPLPTANWQLSTERGFTILFSVLIASILLAIGIAIFDITVRELRLSSIARESQEAIFASDTGAECALYWDFKYNGAESAFASSSPGAAEVICNGHDIVAHGTPPALPFSDDPSTWSPWSESTSGATSTISFTMPLTSGTHCASVIVTKVELTVDPDPPLRTIIESRGYNVACGDLSTDTTATERAVRVTY